ncbi:hypothetical protein SDC9_115685 [bioreactor metagenome]|uniref:Uncharacterized protein n=1 Tax=bioreactor metagenome TaxID=1076179 RepID=A0A645BVW0_9ZZZZ
MEQFPSGQALVEQRSPLVAEYVAITDRISQESSVFINEPEIAAPGIYRDRNDIRIFGER